MTDVTISRETLQAAVDALECALSDSRPYIVKSREVSTTLRAALAAQPAEPVARVVPYGATVKLIWEDTAAAHNCKPGPLYAAPPAPAAVPPGMALVPIEPTEAMLLAGQRNELLTAHKHSAERVRVLREALADAIECVQDWGLYASPYFIEKHDLNGDVKRLRAALEAAQ